MSDVTFQHPDFGCHFREWEKYEDAAAGEEAVKARGDFYLPRPNPADDSDENKARFEGYLRRAVYYNVTGRTLRSLVGLAFAKDPVVELPAELAGLSEDISGSGITLFQHAQRTLGEILKVGRGGLLADYPVLAETPSKADVDASSVQPSLTFYRAANITNWCVKKIGGKYLLTLVVLSETLEEPEEDGFGHLCRPCFRVLRLDYGSAESPTETLAYRVEIWVEGQVEDPQTKQKKTVWEVHEEYAPKQGNGQPWGEIPFTFVGSHNNDWMVDEAPLGDIAVLNIAHYRNSADYEDSVYFIGQPQFYMAGLDQGWLDLLKEKFGSTIYVGSRQILPLPVGGTAGILQAQPNTLAKEAMDAKEKQMLALGGRLIQEGSAVKTATQQNSEDEVSHSVLSLCAENTSAAYRKGLTWCLNFANSAGKAEFTISSEYTASKLDAQTITALLAAVNTGRMPETDFWAALRAPGYIAAEKDDDAVREEIEGQMPAGGTGGTPGSADSTNPNEPAA